MGGGGGAPLPDPAAGAQASPGAGSAPLLPPSDPQDYEFTDTSLVRPAATRVYFSRMFRFVPRWLTANCITLLGFAATVGMFVLALASADVTPALLAGCSFLALQAYVLADHLDGMQALASGTGSPLGEFLDHFSDAISGTFVAFVCLELMPGAAEGIRASVLWLYLLAFIVTYQERAERRHLHFARFGALEGIVIVSAFLLTSAFGAGRAFWASPLMAGIPAWRVLVGIAYLTFGGTVLTILLRIGRVPATFGLHAAASGLWAVAATRGVEAGALDSWLGWALVSIHGVRYLATAMQPHLFGGRPRVDVPGVLLALALLASSPILGVGGIQMLASVALAYLALRAVWAVLVVLRAYRNHWVWVNPAR